MCHCAEFCGDEWNCCWDLAIYRFFTMAAFCHLDFVLHVFGPCVKEHLLIFITVRNLVGIDAVVSIICSWLVIIPDAIMDWYMADKPLVWSRGEQKSISTPIPSHIQLLLGEEAVALPSIGNTLWHIWMVFTHSAITPPEVNRFGWNLGHSEYIVWR